MATGELDDIVLLPDLADPMNGPIRGVKPPCGGTGEHVRMVRDLLDGDLGAGMALLDWLGERARDYTRRWQYLSLTRLLHGLAEAAVSIAEETDRRIGDPNRRRTHVEAAVATWDHFRQQVTEAFALDLWQADSLMRFVADVIAPGKTGNAGGR